MYNEITSSSNKIIKHIKSLSIKKYRDLSCEFVIEGVRLIKDAIVSNVSLNTVVVTDTFYVREENAKIINLLKEQVGKDKLKINTVNDKIFKEISSTETPQGVLAVVSIPKYSFDATPVKEEPFFVMCEEVTEPGNMGTIIRTADAAGADAVIVSRGCVDVYNPKTVRSAMGSIFHIPIISMEDICEGLTSLKNRGVKVISGDLSGKSNHFEVDMTKGIVLVTGNEANGISDEIRNLSDILIKIPILGKAESLNAGVAIGVMIYEAVRQRLNLN